MPLDLSPIVEFLEEEMAATQIVVTSDPTGVDDDVFDPVTLQYTAAPGDAPNVYTGGAIIVPDNNQPAVHDEGGARKDITYYRMRLPLAAPRIGINDRVVVTANERDANMVNAVFFVTSPTESTFTVSAVYQLKRKRLKPTGSLQPEV